MTAVRGLDLRWCLSDRIGSLGVSSYESIPYEGGQVSIQVRMQVSAPGQRRTSTCPTAIDPKLGRKNRA